MDTAIDWSAILPLILALLAGSVIGAEREYRSKSAGLRTIIFICLGASVFTMLSLKLGSPINQDRFAANIITGIGFIGAGVIFKEENRVTGLTTAAIIWVAAAIGVCIGSGYYFIALICVILVVAVQQIFLLIQLKIDKINQNHNYSITCTYQHQTLGYYEQVFKQFSLTVHRGKQIIKNDTIRGQWQLEGSEKNHETCVAFLLKDKNILEFEF